MQAWTVLDNGRPVDWPTAQRGRERLAAELGATVQVQVVPHEGGGYALDCQAQGSEGGLAVTQSPAQPAARALVPTRAARSAAMYPDTFALRPCWRVFLGQALLALLGADFAVRPADFFALFGMPVPASEHVGSMLLLAVRLAAFLQAVICLTQIAWAYATRTWRVDVDGLVQIQWRFERGRIGRCVCHIPFRALGAIDVRQGLLDTLLNIGTLRVEARLGDTNQIQYLGEVGSPRRLQSELQRRARLVQGDALRERYVGSAVAALPERHTRSRLQHLLAPPPLEGPYAALVRIEGLIDSDERASAHKVNESLRAAFADPQAKGVIVLVNSPGGSPVQSALIHDRLLNLRLQHPEKPLWVIGEDMLTSGAYYVAVAAEHICVNRSTMAGSIGVVMSGWGLNRAIERLGGERRVFTAGAHKARLDAFQPLTSQDRAKASTLLDAIHQQFIHAVTAGRGTRLKGTAQELFSGDFWVGEQAVTLGLVDGLCDLESVLEQFGVHTAAPNLWARVANSFGVVSHSLMSDAGTGLAVRLTPP
jgi:signal peptide peptidase SppA